VGRFLSAYGEDLMAADKGEAAGAGALDRLMALIEDEYS